MIGNITKGSDFNGLAHYLYGPGRHNEHTDARAIACANTLILDAAHHMDWVRDMNYAASLNPRVKRTVWHCSLSAAPGDPYLTDDTWALITGQYMKEMGFTENPWVAVRHGDEHVHIVASRVDWDGKCWKDSNDYHENDRVLRRIENRFGLIAVDENYQRMNPAYAKTSIAEREAAVRKGLPMAERAILRDEIAGALRAAIGRGIGLFEQELQKRRIGWHRNLDDNRRMLGYSVTLPGWTDTVGKPIWVQSSRVDKELAWPNIAPQLENPRRSADIAVYRPTSAIVPRSPR